MNLATSILALAATSNGDRLCDPKPVNCRILPKGAPRLEEIKKEVPLNELPEGLFPKGNTGFVFDPKTISGATTLKPLLDVSTACGLDPNICIIVHTRDGETVVPTPHAHTKRFLPDIVSLSNTGGTRFWTAPELARDFRADYATEFKPTNREPRYTTPPNSVCAFDGTIPHSGPEYAQDRYILSCGRVAADNVFLEFLKPLKMDL